MIEEVATVGQGFLLLVWKVAAAKQATSTVCVPRDARRHGLKPLVTLYHFVHPLWFDQLGHFEQAANVRHFVNYAKTVFRRAFTTKPSRSPCRASRQRCQIQTSSLLPRCGVLQSLLGCCSARVWADCCTFPHRVHLCANGRHRGPRRAATMLRAVRQMPMLSHHAMCRHFSQRAQLWATFNEGNVQASVVRVDYARVPFPDNASEQPKEPCCKCKVRCYDLESLPDGNHRFGLL